MLSMTASIRPAVNDAATVSALADILVQTVAGGGSVSFMHPLAPSDAEAFWRTSLAAADRGERVVLCAWSEDLLAATVTLLLDTPPNQPHRSEIAKLMTRPSHRGRGIAKALMMEAERLALERQRTLLTLDTAQEDGAAALYESVGFHRAGLIPDYALKPHGGLTGTILYWKRLGVCASKPG